MATFPLLLCAQRASCASIQTAFHCIRQAKQPSQHLHVGDALIDNIR
jgi:hypothetical protein